MIILTMFFWSPLEQFEVFIIFNYINFFIISNFIIYNFYIFFLFFLFVYLKKQNLKLFPKFNFYYLLFLFNNLIETLILQNINGKKKNNGAIHYFLLFIFFFILFCNLFGMIPYSFTITSHIFITFFLSFFIFFGINIIGIKNHGLKIFQLFLPTGTPLFIAPFLILIEFVLYFSRIFSLSIRLFVNMMAGHTLLKILASFAWIMCLKKGIWLFGFSSAFCFILIITILEIIISFLQAYVFIILLCIYINDVYNLH